MRNFFKHSTAIAVSIGIFLFTLFLLLRIFDSNKSREFNEAPFNKSLIRIQETPGHKFKNWRQSTPLQPESVHRETFSNGEKTIYEVTYTIDQFGLRVVKAPFENPDEHLIFAGCSMIFGVALPNEDTFPTLIQKKYKNKHVVNFSYGAGAVNTHLRALDHFNMKDLTKVPKGKFFYIFIADHFNRWLARPSYLHWAPRYFAHYEIENGEPVFKGELQDEARYKAFQAAREAGLGHTYLRAAAQNDKWSDEEINSFMLGINKLKQKYMADFPEGEFVFMFHPMHSTPEYAVKKIYEAADKLGMKVIDGNKVYAVIYEKNIDMNKLNVELEGHPSALFNKIFAEWFQANVMSK